MAVLLSALPAASRSQHGPPAPSSSGSAGISADSPPPRETGEGPLDAQQSLGEPEGAREESTASLEMLGREGARSEEEGVGALSELGVGERVRGGALLTPSRRRSGDRRRRRRRRRRTAETTTSARRRRRRTAETTTSRKSYQPPIPKANNTPVDWWSGKGFISPMLAKGCPPWWSGKCTRDSVSLAARYIRVKNRCKEGGLCPGGKIANQYKSCVNFNKDKFYPEYNQAGFCITAAPQGYGRHNLAYSEKVIAVNRVTANVYLAAIKWSQQDAPARLTCDSFCKKCDKATEYCPDTAETPIAAGEHGNCECFCRAGSRAADFDRCTTVSKAVCTDAAYCGGHGKATFTVVQGQDEGTCGCSCGEGWSGRNCELEDGEPCTINDCHHRTYEVDEGKHPYGIRPNCKCNCGGGNFNFDGDDCSTWTWKGNGRTGTWPSTSTNFTIQVDLGCSARLDKRTRILGPGC